MTICINLDQRRESIVFILAAIYVQPCEALLTTAEITKSEVP